MTTLYATEKPGVYVAESDSQPGVFYPLTGVTTPFPCCSCPAALRGRTCKHVEAALDLAVEQLKGITVTENTTAIAIAQRSPMVVRAEEKRLAAAAALAGWNDLVALGGAHIRTGFAPKDVSTPEQAGLILLKALELDIPITAAYEFVAVIHGRPKLMGQMVDALVSRSGKGYIHIEQSDSKGATAIGYREGRKPIKVTFTVADAQAAGLLSNDSWKKFPADHCRWKAITRVGRLMFADVLGGMDVADGEGYELDSPSSPAGGRVEVIEGEVVRASTVDESTGEVLEAEAPASEVEAGAADVPPASAPSLPKWTDAAMKRMAELELTPSDVASHMGRPFDWDEVAAYCRDMNYKPAELLKVIAEAKYATTPAA